MPREILSESVAHDQIRAFIERIERMEEEKKAIADDIKEIYAEAKGNGFDTKVLRQIVRIRKMDHNERMEQEALLELYMGALGMAPMPLFDDDDDDTDPPGGGSRQPEHRAEGMRPIASVASANVGGLKDQLSDTNSALSQAEASGTLPDATAGAHVPPDHREASAQPIQQVSGMLDAAAQTVPIVASGVSSVSTEQASVESSGPMQDGSGPAEAHNLGQAGSTPAPATNSENAEAAPQAGDGSAPHVATSPASNAQAEPGVIIIERTPPVGIAVHPYAACWPVNAIEVGAGIRKPIVKIGHLILDGRGRYFAARDAGAEYPVVQYDGTDPLLDCIRWNLDSRNPSEAQRGIIAHKLAKLEPARADEIMAAFGIEHQREAAE